MYTSDNNGINYFNYSLMWRCLYLTTFTKQSHMFFWLISDLHNLRKLGSWTVPHTCAAWARLALAATYIGFEFWLPRYAVITKLVNCSPKSCFLIPIIPTKIFHTFFILLSGFTTYYFTTIMHCVYKNKTV